MSDIAVHDYKHSNYPPQKNNASRTEFDNYSRTSPATDVRADMIEADPALDQSKVLLTGYSRLAKAETVAYFEFD